MFVWYEIVYENGAWKYFKLEGTLNENYQGWGAVVRAGVGRSRVFFAPWSQSRLRKKTEAGAAWKKSQEPEPLKN